MKVPVKSGSKSPFRIAVASGKGGTGKTTVALGLAQSLGGRVQLLDCDVEAPNDHLFLPAADPAEESFPIRVPRIDPSRCTLCGTCVEFCAFGALATAGGEVLVFDDLCHACGGCTIVCPEAAIQEVDHPIGTITSFPTSPLRHVFGELAIGQALVPPLIREVKRREEPDVEVVIVDAPPGATCPMVATVSGADYGLLVTEDTPFGLHDLEVAADVLKETGIPTGVVMNRADLGDGKVDAFCRERGIPVLMRIDYDEVVASGYAAGRTIVESRPSYRQAFVSLYERMVEQTGRPKDVGSPDGAHKCAHAPEEDRT